MRVPQKLHHCSHSFSKKEISPRPLLLDHEDMNLFRYLLGFRCKCPNVRSKYLSSLFQYLNNPPDHFQFQQINQIRGSSLSQKLWLLLSNQKYKTDGCTQTSYLPALIYLKMNQIQALQIFYQTG